MDFLLPELGEGVYEAEMTRWLVKAGDVVKPGQALLEVLTDKATMEVPAPFAGKITALKVQPGDKLTIGQAILTYEGKAGAATPSAPAVKAASKTAVTPAAIVPARNGPMLAEPGVIQAAPAVRQMARKLGIDLAKLRGSGPHGRILIDDLAINLPAAQPTAPPPDYGTGARVKLVGLRRKVTEHMVQSKRNIPYYT